MSSPKSVKSEEMGSLFNAMEFEEEHEQYQPSIQDFGLDEKAIERIISSDSKQVLNTLLLDDGDRDPSCYVVFNYPSDPHPKKVFKTIALACAPSQPTKVERVGKGLYNILFATKEEAEMAFATVFSSGKMVSKGRPISFFYRATYSAEEIRKDHETRIIRAIKEKLNVEAVSVTINENKGCGTAYFSSVGDFSYILSDVSALEIKIPQGGPFAPAYWIHLNRCTATSSNPAIIKMQISPVPHNASEAALLSAVKEVLAPVVSPQNILGLAIYCFPDSGKSSRFGFVHVLGAEIADILERVMIPIPNSKIPMIFQRAVERPYGEGTSGPASSPGNNSGNRRSPPGPYSRGSPGPSSNSSGSSGPHNNVPKRKERDWE